MESIDNHIWIMLHSIREIRINIRIDSLNYTRSIIRSIESRKEKRVNKNNINININNNINNINNINMGK